MTNNSLQLEFTDLTVALLSSYVAHNRVRSEDLPQLIVSTHAALRSIAHKGAPATDGDQPQQAARARAVQMSLASPSHIISMIDGKPYRSLKRHIAANGLTPDEYRKRYNLPGDYPMVSSEYSEARRKIAKHHRLGHRNSGRE